MRYFLFVVVMGAVAYEALNTKTDEHVHFVNINGTEVGVIAPDGDPEREYRMHPGQHKCTGPYTAIVVSNKD